MFVKTLFQSSFIKRTKLLIRKTFKKNFYAFPILPKIEFLLYFTNLVPVLSVQKNGEKNSKNDFCSIYPDHKSEILGGKKNQKN